MVSMSGLPRCDELLQSGEGDGGRWLAADAFGADLSFGEGDLVFGDLLDPASRRVRRRQSFLPGGRIADADGSGQGVGLSGTSLLTAVGSWMLR